MHLDPPEHRKPLPLVEMPDLEDLIRPGLDGIKSIVGRVATPTADLKIRLYSDSEHLRQFFAYNWRGGDQEEPSSGDDAVIVALRGGSDVGIPAIAPGVRYIDPERRLIVSVGSEYYGNIKVSVRGLCSSAISRLGRGGFLHGASMILGNAGLVVAGVSGAGKTTITRALLELYPGEVRIINDDWGWADQDSATIAFTGEPRLHMKYRSVHTIAPHLALSPDHYPSENFHGDLSDPHARLLIPRDEVFSAAVADFSSFDTLVMVIRDASSAKLVQEMPDGAIDILEASEYSDFYGRNERFMDGSLLILDDNDLQSERRRFARLLHKIPAVLVNNVADPALVTRELARYLGL